MQVKLRVMRGSSAGKEIGLKGPKFLIGRAEECQMRARSDAISRRHCAVFLRKTGAVVRDLGSRNGTFVNGSRIEGDQPIVDGDHLQVGPLEFVVVVQESVKAKATMSAAKQEPDGVGDLVSQWLDEVEDPEPAALAEQAAADTGRFYADDTEQVTVDAEDGENAGPSDLTKIGGVTANDQQTEDAADADVQIAEDAASDSDSASIKKKEMGKLPKRTDRPDAPKNTQEAAAQMLRKMWNRR